MIENMQDFINEWGLEDDVIILEPQNDFNKGIVGVTEDRHHIVYSLDKLAIAFAESFQKEDKCENKEMEFHDWYMEAVEYLDFNTVRAIPYMNQDYAPILMYDVKE